MFQPLNIDKPDTSAWLRPGNDELCDIILSHQKFCSFQSVFPRIWQAEAPPHGRCDYEPIQWRCSTDWAGHMRRWLAELCCTVNQQTHRNFTSNHQNVVRNACTINMKNKFSFILYLLRRIQRQTPILGASHRILVEYSRITPSPNMRPKSFIMSAWEKHTKSWARHIVLLSYNSHISCVTQYVRKMKIWMEFNRISWTFFWSAGISRPVAFTTKKTILNLWLSWMHFWTLHQSILWSHHHRIMQVLSHFICIRNRDDLFAEINFQLKTKALFKLNFTRC